MDSHGFLNSVFENHGLSHWNWTPLQKPLSMDIYKSWIDKAYHGDMVYLKNHIPQKENPQNLLPQALSAFVFTVEYGLKPNTLPLKNLRVASYAQDEDYHLWFKEKAQRLCKDLQSLFPQHAFVGFTDSSPVLERDLAYQAGLGWFGKNTCLIDRKRGSFFFIGEIYSTLPYLLAQNPTPSLDHCGTCDRCIVACPTNAIEPQRTLNATKCISYWTIESKKIPPPDLREQFSDWFFGCDICQTVCPWNIKVRDLAPPPPVDPTEDLRWILESSNKTLMRQFAHTPLSRAGGRGLKRNALIVIANKKITSLAPNVRAYLTDPQLGELAQWTMDKLSDSCKIGV
jgi:epoxyqueuosine reductase